MSELEKSPKSVIAELEVERLRVELTEKAEGLRELLYLEHARAADLQKIVNEVRAMADWAERTRSTLTAADLSRVLS
jgi:hypothetical protein